jgi:uncharacterized membrane protein YoaK (UPF0700 family)
MARGNAWLALLLFLLTASSALGASAASQTRNEWRASGVGCLLVSLVLCAALAFMTHEGRDSELGRDTAIIAGLLAGMMVGMTAGAGLGASRWGWHSGETWYAILIPALMGCMGGPLLGGGLAAYFARKPGRPRFITGAVASGTALLVSLGLAILFW